MVTGSITNVTFTKATCNICIVEAYKTVSTVTNFTQGIASYAETCHFVVAVIADAFQANY